METTKATSRRQEATIKVLQATKIPLLLNKSSMSSHDDIPPAKPNTEGNQRRHQCKQCPLSFETGQQLGGHMRKHYPGVVNPKRRKPQMELNLEQQQQQEEANSKQQKKENVNLKQNHHEVNSKQQQEDVNSKRQKQENVNLKQNQHEVSSKEQQDKVNLMQQHVENLSRRFELGDRTINSNKQLPDWIKEEILRREEKKDKKEEKKERKEEEGDEKNEKDREEGEVEEEERDVNNNGIFFRLLPSGNNKNKKIKLYSFI